LLASLETSGVPLIERRYSRGEHAYMRGDPDEGLWFLLEGTMELYKLYGAFSKATVRPLDGSGLFGERPLLRHLSEDSSCAPALLQAFAECAEEREAAVQRLLERKVDSRLASLLLELAERFGEEGGRGRGLRMRLSHHDLSCMVACTREAVSQAMGELREAGLIETPRPCRVVVLDEPRLSKVAMGQAITAQDEFAGIPRSSRGRVRSHLPRREAP
jgi:CRP/FNR family transcriptional regulator